MTDFNGQTHEAEPRTPAEFIARIKRERREQREQKAQADARAAEVQRQQAVAVVKHMQPWGLSQRGFIHALAKGIVPWIKEVLQPLEERLAKLEAATGLSKTAKQPGVEAISPVIARYIDARLAPTEKLVADHDSEMMRYADIYEPGRTYQRGQVVTLNGGWWLARETTDTRPGKDGSWKLTVKSTEPGRPRPRDADET